jgi:hypothetical protein
LLLATVATLMFVPAVFALLHGRRRQQHPSEKPADRHIAARA